MDQLMEGWFSKFGLLGTISTVIAALGVLSVFIAKLFLNDPKKKAYEDKLLLKELLEGFGLEVPSELNEPDPSVMKSIKTP